MEKNLNQFLSILSDSIEVIEEKYINLSVAGKEDTIQRERIYCGELYHQIRTRIVEMTYEINNEPNKIKHPIIEASCGAVDPDFIIHRPGSMGEEDNLAVIEVKRSTGDLIKGIIKDITTINCMTSIENGYYAGIIIIYGYLTKSKKDKLIERIKFKTNDIKKLLLVFHESPGNRPQIIEL